MQNKICYYFGEDGRFGGEGLILPIEGNFILPFTATWTAPEFQVGFFAVWNGETWIYEEYPQYEDYEDFEATYDPISEQGEG